MKVISLLQLKGGTGRTTVAVTLAGELCKTERTALIDADAAQGSASSWAALRAEDAPPLAVHRASTPRELMAAVERLKETADYVVIDGAPRLHDVTRAALVLSDLVLVPIGASAAEIWATSDLKPLLAEAEQLRRVNVRLIWNRHRPHTRLAQELGREAEKAIGLRALKTSLRLRVAFVEALGTGRTAAEVGDPAAKEEVTALVHEVLRILR